MILYPAIDIRGGHAVRLVEGDYDRETVFDADPVDAAMRFADAGVHVIHVVDLDGAKAGHPVNLETVRRIADAVPFPIQVGGGLRDAECVSNVLRAGVEHVVIGTAARCEGSPGHGCSAGLLPMNGAFGSLPPRLSHATIAFTRGSNCPMYETARAP